MQHPRHMWQTPMRHPNGMPQGFQLGSGRNQPCLGVPMNVRQSFMFQQSIRNCNPFFNGMPQQMQQQSGMALQQGPGRVQQVRNLKRKRPSSPKAVETSSKKKREERSSSPQTLVVSDQYTVAVTKGTEKITMAIWEYFLDSKMSDEDLKKKLMLRKSLQTIMQKAFPNCRLYIVGSSMTGFAMHNSDVDMCLTISDDDIDQKREATSVLLAIQKALRHCSFVRNPIVIRAKVPILKFQDRLSNVECDLNINNTIGIRNTHLLRHYAYMDWRVRPLMLFIKKWARYHDINDASKKTISSYSLSLMLIHYLQAGVQPPVLPCLQGMRADLFRLSTDWNKLSLCMDKDINFTSKNQATLGELFLGFLNYYTNVFHSRQYGISVRLGKKVNRANLDPNDQWKFLAIEEPFEGSNTARSVYDQFVFSRICRVIARSFHTLVGSRDPADLFKGPF